MPPLKGFDPFSDVNSIYVAWLDSAAAGEGLVGIDRAWVYPPLALPVIGLPYLLAPTPEGYQALWFVLIAVLDALAFLALVGVRGALPAGRERAAWWWTAAIVAVGSVAVGRIDAVTVPLAVIAFLVAAQRPAFAAVLLAVGTWIKVWPAGLLLALLVVVRRRLRVVLAAAAVCVAVAASWIALGATAQLVSFVGGQTGRGAQLESATAVPYLWLGLLGAEEVEVFYSEIIAMEVDGPGMAVATALSDVLMLVLIVAASLLGVRAVRSGAERPELLAVLGTAIVAALIVCNKVGSPQYLVWFIAPIALGFVVAGRRFDLPALLVLAAALFAQFNYPFFYGQLERVRLLPVLATTAKSALVAAVLVWALVALVRAGSRRSAAAVEARPVEAG
nr:glycosyltransferase 87 family protein [Agromyces seonyuensis]